MSLLELIWSNAVQNAAISDVTILASAGLGKSRGAVEELHPTTASNTVGKESRERIGGMPGAQNTIWTATGHS